RHTRWPRDWSSDVCSSDLFRLVFLVQSLQLFHVFRSFLGQRRARIAPANDFIIEVSRAGMIGPLVEFGGAKVLFGLLHVDADQLDRKSVGRERVGFGVVGG